jgi:succinate dehydrogenase / fumarate reductase flavoprotein subunit
VADTIAGDIPALPEPSRGPVGSAIQAAEAQIGEILGRPAGDSPFAILHELQETMSLHFGIFRDGKTMGEGLGRIRALKERSRRASPGNRERAVNQALVRYLELEGMLLLAETVALGAMAREESRGSHTRRDYPERDDERFLAHTVAAMEEGGIAIRHRPVTLGMFPVGERGY